MHKIYLILISNSKDPRTALYYKQLIVSLQNNVKDNLIWTDKHIVKDYLMILVKGIAYGNSEIMD